MELLITGRNMDVTPRLDDHVRRKLSRLDRYLPSIASGRMELAVETAKSASDRQVAQLTVRSENGVILRAEERTADMFASIDAVTDKMYRQIVRYKGKRQRARKGGAVPEVIVPLDMDEMVDLEETPGEIVRVKRFSLVPMMQEEAIEQMELLGHSFFVFYNVDEDGVNVLYRRHDGNYGLIVPALD